jgi:thymidylate synthase
MFVLSGNDVNDVYPMAITLLNGVGRPEYSRYGDVIVAPRPVTSHYEYPRNRVLLDPHRDANPFFHLMESLWILAGREDVAWLAQFNSRISEFSDDGQRFHGAYGKRLRRWQVSDVPAEGTVDQLEEAVHMLRMDPGNRRVVLSIWDPRLDLNTVSKDIPCNDMVKLEIRDNRLNLIVFNRSNDIIWGCYGANVVQFSMIQEYLAGRLQCGIGFMEQVSTNWHAYVKVWADKTAMLPDWNSPYQMGKVEALPMFDAEAHPEHWDVDLRHFMRKTGAYDGTLDGWGSESEYHHDWFSTVAEPMFLGWKMWKEGKKMEAHLMLDSVMASDWQKAGQEWMERRMGV